ncbi:hypothetical protein HJFPF1_07082 [Paramyrothecium foliicola]|nr:hypothetical protein HJFPF1_07082 [Paramyrothecium foliicola]
MIAPIENLEPDTSLKAVVSKHPEALAFAARDGVIQARYILKLAPEDTPNHLTHGTLTGLDAISTPPYVFFDNASGSLIAFYQLGTSLSGHIGIVHGGIIATLLDECMGRACFPKLQHKIAVTAKLEVEYKKPIPAGSIVYVLAETRDVQGRKANVEASIRSAEDDTVFASSKALFVEPKYASTLTKLM